MCCTKRPKIRIVEFTHDLIDPDIITANTADGKQLSLKRVKREDLPKRLACKSPLYASRNKLFFTLYRGRLGQIFEAFSPTCRIRGRHCHNGKRGNDYPKLTNFGHIACHTVVLRTFQGPKPIVNGVRYEGDHKNGDICDWNNDNLEWVSPKENRRRCKVLNALRSIGINPVQVPYNVLDIFLNKKIVSDMTVLTSRLKKLRDLLDPLFAVFYPDDFKRWLMMPQDEFDQMISMYHRDPSFDQMEYEMTHHMEC